LIWPAVFAARLALWNQLRSQAQDLPAEQALTAINAWWFRAPWTAYHLHWDDQDSWPDPWQLLSDNIYCDVARGLGILYTITLLDREDLAPADLVLTQEGHNLVLLPKEKYILNWEPDTVVNTFSELAIQQRYRQKSIT